MLPFFFFFSKNKSYNDFFFFFISRVKPLHFLFRFYFNLHKTAYPNDVYFSENIFIIECIHVVLWIAFWIKIDPGKIMSDTPLTLMQTVKPISAQNRYKPIWHNPQTVAVRALRDTWTRWLLRVCSQLRIRCAHNHSIRRHSVIITFLAVNKLNRLSSPKYCLNVSPCIKHGTHFSLFQTHLL